MPTPQEEVTDAWNAYLGALMELNAMEDGSIAKTKAILMETKARLAFAWLLLKAHGQTV